MTRHTIIMAAAAALMRGMTTRISFKADEAGVLEIDCGLTCRPWQPK